jgi:hypothetical protein
MLPRSLPLLASDAHPQGGSRGGQRGSATRGGRGGGRGGSSTGGKDARAPILDLAKYADQRGALVALGTRSGRQLSRSARQVHRWQRGHGPAQGLRSGAPGLGVQPPRLTTRAAAQPGARRSRRDRSGCVCNGRGSGDTDVRTDPDTGAPLEPPKVRQLGLVVVRGTALVVINPVKGCVADRPLRRTR